MANNQYRVGDIGVVFRATMQTRGTDDTLSTFDASSYTTLEMIFRDKAGETKTKTAVFTTDGSNGQLQYVSEASTFEANDVGTWYYTPRVAKTGSTITGLSWVEMEVLPNAD